MWCQGVTHRDLSLSAPEGSHAGGVWAGGVRGGERHWAVLICYSDDFNKHERNWNTNTGMEVKVQRFSVLTSYFIRENERSDPSCQDFYSTLWHWYWAHSTTCGEVILIIFGIWMLCITHLLAAYRNLLMLQIMLQHRRSQRVVSLCASLVCHLSVSQRIMKHCSVETPWSNVSA